MPEKTVKDIDAVISGIREGSFIEDSREEQTARKYWSYEPWGEHFQIGFHKSTKKIRAAFAANRIGKSLMSFMEVFIMATGHVPDKMKKWYPMKKIAPPNSIFFLATIKDDLHREITLPLINSWVPLKTFGIEYVQSRKVFKCPNGIQIFLKSYEAGWETFQGSGVWGIVLDEEPTDKKIYTECLTRILSTGGYLWFSMTPLKGFTWIFYDVAKAAEKDKGIDVFNGKMSECPHLTKKEVDELVSKFPEHERRSRANGEFCVSVEQHVFPSETVNKWLNEYKSPAAHKRISIVGEPSNTIADFNLAVIAEDASEEFVPFVQGQDEVNPAAIWQIWHEPQQGRGYIIGVDVASGQGAQTDHSVAHVKTAFAGGTIQHCATLRTNCIKPYDFGRLIVAGAKYFNNALVAIENEGYGDAAIDAMRWYPFQWYSNVYDANAKVMREKKCGFGMKRNMRTLVLEAERDLINRNGCPIVHERETMNEMMLFRVCDDGRYDHPRGGRSDGVIASSIADFISCKYPHVLTDNRRKMKQNENAGTAFAPRYVPKENTVPRHLGMRRSKSNAMAGMF